MKRLEAYRILTKMQNNTESSEQAQALEIALNDIEFVDLMPKDMVEVTRCKDCKHLMFSDCYGECSAGHYGIVRPDHFCSYGEKRED